MVRTEDRLNRLGLTTLYQRRIRGDLVETYKILTGKVNVDSDNFFCLHTNSHNTRGHSLKLSGQRSRLDVRKNFFSLKVVRIWNSLPQDVVNSTSVTMFKRRLDKCCTDWIRALKAPPTKLIIIKVKVKVKSQISGHVFTLYTAGLRGIQGLMTAFLK